jgi:hypothetical protein
MLQKFSEAFFSEDLPCRNFQNHFSPNICSAENFSNYFLRRFKLQKISLK